MSEKRLSSARSVTSPGLTGLLLLLLAVVSGCGSQDTATTIPADYLAFEADGIVFGMVHRITQDGQIQGLVRADTAIQWQDSAAVHLRGVDLTVMEEDGSQRAHVTSKSGILDTRTNRMAAYGDVVGNFEGDRRIESQELHYDPQGDQIRSDSAFVFTEGGRVTRGQAFTSDLEFRNFRVTGSGAARP